MQRNDVPVMPAHPPRRGPVKAVLAWLLELDRPVPVRSDDEIAAEVERNYVWNFAVNLGDGTWFLFGASMISATTMLPLFLSKLTTNPFWFGLLAVIGQAGWFLPQLFTANWMERLPRKKPVVINLGFFSERVPVWLMPLAALVAVQHPGLALGAILAAYAWHNVGAGIVAVSWQDLLARCFPVNRRGKFFGMTTFAGATTGVLGALLSSWLLRRYPFPTSFIYAFAIAAGAILLSWIFLALTREPVRPVSTPRRSSAEYLASLPDLLRQDHNYRRFLVTRVLMAFAALGSGFVTVAAVTRWDVPDATAGLFTLALWCGQTAGNLTFGFLADRHGHKVCLELGTAAGVLGFALAWLAPDPAWYYAVFVLLGILSSAVLVPGLLIVMEFSAPDRRPTYLGITNTAAGIAGVIAPLVGAALMQVGFGWLFAIGAALNLLALALFHWWVREPRRAAEMMV